MKLRVLLGLMPGERAPDGKLTAQGEIGRSLAIVAKKSLLLARV
jgi:hypothetical protein